MRNTFKQTLTLVLCLCSLLAFPLSSDHVSPRSWVMSALGSMSAKGLLDIPSRLFFSDGTFSRGEVAKVVENLIERAREKPWDFADEDLYVLGKLIDEFSQELKTLGVDPFQTKEELELSYYKELFWGSRLAGMYRYEGNSTDKSESRLLYRFPLIIPVGEGFAYISTSNERRWLADKPSDFPLLDSALIKTPWLDADWEVGRGYVRLGPGYINSIWLGDTPPPYDYILMSKNFKAGSLGFFNFKQFHTTYEMGGVRRYYIARRIEKNFKNWDIALYDIHISDQFPSIFAFVPILPLYAVQYFWENDFNVNVVMGLEVARNYPNGAIYADWYIDDITTFPHHVPRKTAFLFGGRKDFDNSILYLEYVQVDQETYTHKNPNNSYYYKGYIMGFPIGPDSRGVYLRWDNKKNFPLIIQIALITQQKSSPTPAKTTSLNLLLPYDLGTDKSITLGINPYRTEKGGKAERGLGLEIRAEYDF